MSDRGAIESGVRDALGDPQTVYPDGKGPTRMAADIYPCLRRIEKLLERMVGLMEKGGVYR